MRFLKFAFCAALSVVTMTACGDKAKPVADAAPAESDSVRMMTGATPLDSLGRPIGRFLRETTKSSYIRIEGDSQAVTLDLVQAPVGFPVEFSTYKTNDMQLASAKIGSNASITMSPVFGAEPNPLAFVQIQFDTVALPAKDAAGAVLKAFTSGLKLTGLTVTPNDRYPFATDAKSFRYTTSDGEPVTGSVIVGRRGSQTYRILVQYPPEFGDGMSPRVGVILRHFRWDDDFTYLVK